MTLENGKFEADWSEEKSHKCYVIDGKGNGSFADIGNIFSPPGWIPWLLHTDEYAQPEGRDARATSPVPRMRSGDKGYLLFTFGRRHCCGLFQQIGVKSGSLLTFSAWPHAWSNHKDDQHPNNFPHPDDARWSDGAGYDQIAWKTDTLELTGDAQNDAKSNFSFGVGIDPSGGIDPFADGVVWSDEWSIYNGYVKQLIVESVKAQANTATVFLASSTLWPFKHNDAYWDDAELLIKEGEPSGHRGAPRVQYAREYWVIPQDAGSDRAVEIFELALPTRRTVGFSADDAGIGDLDARTALLWDIEEERVPEYEGFYAEHYPGVNVKFENVIKTDTPNPDVPQFSPVSEYYGIHRQTNVDGLYEFMAVRPEWTKLVYGIEDAQRTKDAGAQNIVYRKPVAHQGKYTQGLDVDGYLNEYDPTTLEKHIDWVDAIEGTNEENPNDLQVLNFEAALSDEVRRRWGDDLLLVSGNWAVGNGEGEALVPWARTLMNNGHIAGYHPYFPVDLTRAEEWMESEAEWYHLRHLYHIDPVLRANGVYVQWVGTEGGAVRAYQSSAARSLTWDRLPGPSVQFDDDWLAAKKRKPMLGCADSQHYAAWEWFAKRENRHYVGHLDPGGGWRHPEALNADLDRYIALLLRLREKSAEWNARHGNRDRGHTIFTVGATFVGWDWFKMWEHDLDALREALSG